MWIKVIMVGILLSSCSPTTTRFGYWLDRGSNTFPGVYQCVETFKPFINKEC